MGFKVTKDWDSSQPKDEPDLKRRTAVDRIREKAAKYVEKVKQEHEYRKTPEYRKKQIDKLNQQAEMYKAHAKVAEARAKISKYNKKRYQDVFSGLGGLGLGGGLTSNQNMGFSGFDSMFGFGSPGKKGKANTSSYPTKGFDDLFGFG